MVKTSRELFKKNLLSKYLLKITLITLFFTSGFVFAGATNISFSPNSANYSADDTFSIEIEVTDNQVNINGVSGLVSFPTDILKVTSVSKSGSIISTWAEEPTYSNQEGVVSFEGVILNPGFSVSSGKIITITFKALKSGTANLTFKSGQVLANDGNATSVLQALGNASFEIKEVSEKVIPVPEVVKVAAKPAPKEEVTNNLPVIKSLSYPDSEKWYSNRNASFEWNLPSTVTAVRTLYGIKETSTPTKVYDPAISNRNFTTDSDGVMYMNVQFKTGSSWGTIAHYKFQIDTESPSFVKVEFPGGSIITSSTPTIFVKAEDVLSGITSLSMSIDGGTSFSFTIDPLNLYTLPKQGAGKHTIVVSATDKAGNIAIKNLDYTIQPIATPVITDYTKNLTTESRLQISGTTYPKTIVEATIVRRSISNTLSLGSLVSRTNTTEDFKDTQTTVSDESGKFNLTWSKNLDSSIYELKLRAIDANNSPSEYTDGRVIVVENIILIRFGMFIMNWLSLLLMAIITIVAIIATFWFSFVQFSSFRRKVRRTMAEVEETLKTNVVSLKKDLIEFSSVLLKAEKKRDLTKEEKTLLKKFTKHLESTEKEIEKKLESIQ